MDAPQCLYRGVMGALGYVNNTQQFLELAARAPLEILESIVGRCKEEKPCLAWLQAVLLGTAGLLPWQHTNLSKTFVNDEWKDRLGKIWLSLKHTEAMSRNAWDFRVRPINYPVRRIAAVANLLWLYRDTGFFIGMLDLIRAAVFNGNHRILQDGLEVTDGGYWDNRFSFGLNNTSGSQKLIGSGLASIIAVNVLLPFAVAWSRIESWPELEKRALNLYHCYPSLPLNAVEKHMKHQLGIAHWSPTARTQQGLLHIYKNYCTQGKCKICSLREFSNN